MPDKAFHVALGLIVRHAGKAEVAHDAVHVDLVADERQLVEHLLRRAPGHQLGEVARRAVHAVAPDVAADVAVELVALVGAEVLGGHFVVPHDGVVVAADVFVGQLLGAVGVLIDEEKPAAEGLRRLAAVLLAVDLSVDGEILLDDVPRLLRNHQQADAEARHDGHGLRRHRRREGAAAEGTHGIRA